MPKVTQVSRRKADHIRINLEEDVRSGVTTGLERLQLEHNALPEIDLGEVDTTLTFLGRRLLSPTLFSLSPRLPGPGGWPWGWARCEPLWRSRVWLPPSRSGRWLPTSCSWPMSALSS